MTSLPAGPPVAAAAPPYEPTAPAPAPSEPLAPVFSPATTGAVAELLATGEWAATAAPPAAQAPAVAQPEVPLPSRVQLGFRDGTSAPLDPASSQFAQLEALARSLTRRD